MNNGVKSSSSEDVDIKKTFGRYLDYWKMYLIIMALCIAAGFLFVKYVTPMYMASTKILIQSSDQSSGSSSASPIDLSGLFSTKNSVYDELTIITTQDLLVQIVDALNLNVRCFDDDKVNPQELYNASPFQVKFYGYKDAFDALNYKLKAIPKRKGQVSITDTNTDSVFTVKFNDTVKTTSGKFVISPTAFHLRKNKQYSFTIKPRWSAVNELFKNLTTVYTNTQSSIIELDYNSNVSIKAVDVLNTLIQKYFQRNLNEKNRVADSAIAFIDSRIVIVQSDLNNLESGIEHFKQSNKIIDINLQSAAVSANAQTFYAKANDIEVQLNVVKTTLDYLLDDKNNHRPVPSLLNNDPIFLQLTTKYNDLQMQRDQYMFSLKENNSFVVNLDEQIKNVRADMIKSLQSQIKTLELSKAQIQSESSATNSTIYNIPVQEKTYVGLTRQRDVEQELYLFLLQKKEETALTKASNIASATVVDSPKTAMKPYFPNIPIVFTICIFLGLFLPTAYIIIKHALNNKILNREDVSRVTNANILAEIGHTKDVSLLSLESEGRSITAEQFRIFRTNLNFLTAQKKCPKVLITSSMSGEGKSFISANLALVHAYLGKRVLLMEMDLRRPHLSNMFERKNTNGFTNFMINGGNIEDFIQQLPIDKNLFLLSSGPVPPNPAELILSEIMENMMAKLSTMFDLIIIDTPPIGIITDAQILSKYSDVNLFVVRERYTFKNNLEIVNDLLETEKLNNLYVIINDVIKGASYRYGYGYGYGYSYGKNNDYYTSGNSKKKGVFSLFRKK